MVAEQRGQSRYRSPRWEQESLSRRQGFGSAAWGGRELPGNPSKVLQRIGTTGGLARFDRHSTMLLMIPIPTSSFSQSARPIVIKSQITIPSYVTVAGESAPGTNGITVYGDEAEVKDANHVVVRYLRFRDKDRNLGPGDHMSEDTFEIINSEHVIMDDCSCAWGNDGTLEIWDADYVTVQWTMISETLLPAFAGHAYRGKIVRPCVT